MNSAVLVTGGAGYIGSHAALALIEKGEHVVILDDFSAGAPVVKLESATYVEGNVGDTSLVTKVIDEYDIKSILHFAGFIRVDESMREPEKYLHNNTENTRTLVETAERCGVEHFIFSSSAAVYGNPEHVPIAEDSPTVPINPYGESKLRAEKVIAESGVASVILRYFNVAGADPAGRTGYRIEAKPTHMIRSCIRALLDGKTLTINGSDYPTKDGTCVRDYMHVSDLADAHVVALNHLHKGSAPRTYNCGDGHGYSNLEVVQAVGRVAGKDLPHVFGPRREGDPAELVADSSRIYAELGWKPHYGLEDMIKHELAWVRARVGN